MADIFISYSKARVAEASELAGELGDLGYDVWWDTSLRPTGSFGEEIDRQLEAAKAVIVIWSPESVRSNWVRSEAMHAERQKKLVNAHTSDITDPSLQIPKPFDITHSVLVAELRPLIGALDQLNVSRSGGAPRTAEMETSIAANVADADDGLFAEVERRGTAADYEYYLNELPEGRHALVARMRLRDLQQELEAQQQPVAREAGEAKQQQAEAEPLRQEEERRKQEADRRQKTGPWKVSVGVLGSSSKRKLKPGDVFRDFEQGPEMVIIPPGKFMMGSPKNEPERFVREIQHEVTITQSFGIGRYAVTFDEWDAYTKEMAGHYPGGEGWGRGRRPVINVSWDDAQTYIKWLNDKTGHVYRLPSEAEWEYACRAGTATIYSTGDQLTKQQAQFSQGEFESAGQTVEVGRFPPNQFGLHDMHGNVWEWCEDWNGDYTRGQQTDPKGPKSGSRRVNRGGSWSYYAKGLRSAFRFSAKPVYRCNELGFRLARDL